MRQSSIPWIDFTDPRHSGSMSKGQSIPRISTGKLVASDSRLCMSLSVKLNHGLADGRRVGNPCVLHRPTLHPARFNLLFYNRLTLKTCRVQAIFAKTRFWGKEKLFEAKE